MIRDSNFDEICISYFKKIVTSIFLFFNLINCLQSQKTLSLNFVTSSINNITTILGYLERFIDFKTSKCDGCPPICLSINPKTSLLKIDN